MSIDKLSLEGLDFQATKINIKNNILTITLNRPEKKNALNNVMMNELNYALAYAKQERKIRVVVIDAEGDIFCAGADLSLGEKTFDKSFDTKAKYESDFRRDAGGILNLKIYNSLKPIISACNGDAIGVGATMQLPTDVRIASKSSRFGFVFAKRGIVPDGCASHPHWYEYKNILSMSLLNTLYPFFFF